MAENSKIEWTEHTFSPWWGCTKVSDGCANCYAERDSKKWGFDCFGPGKERRRLSEATWRNPIKWNKAAEKAGKVARVFPSMCDVFDPEGPRNEKEKLYDLINKTPWLLWMLLTKRPENIKGMTPMRWWDTWPKNVWLGVTVEDNRYRGRIDEMMKVPAAGYFVSHEPALGPLDFEGKYLNYLEPFTEYDPMLNKTPRINLIITGGESGSEARPMHPDWARGARDQCLAANVPWCFKQWGEWAPYDGEIAREYETIPREKQTPDLKWIKEYSQFPDRQGMLRVGKKKAGRVLDGRVWDGREA